jgi:hypothetical protein
MSWFDGSEQRLQHDIAGVAASNETEAVAIPRETAAIK